MFKLVYCTLSSKLESPSELVDDMSDVNLAGTSTHSTNRFASTTNSQAHGNDVSLSSAQDSPRAGFGIARRSSSLKPWVKFLTDIGWTPYYFKNVTARTEWTRPVPTQEFHIRTRFKLLRKCLSFRHHQHQLSQPHKMVHRNCSRHHHEYVLTLSIVNASNLCLRIK